MFLGHFAVAMGAKRWTGSVSLGTLTIAAQWADLLWPFLLLSGIEHATIDPGITGFTPIAFEHYPWSHSLLLGLVWGLVLGGLHFAWRHDRGDALIVGGLVPSHWLLDVVVHRPDLPIWPGGPAVGMGLWDSIAGTLLVEGLLFAIGAGLYLRATRAHDRLGRWGAWVLIAGLLIFFLVSSFGPVPTDTTSLAVGAMSLWILVAAAFWVDERRSGDERRRGP